MDEDKKQPKQTSRMSSLTNKKEGKKKKKETYPGMEILLPSSSISQIRLGNDILGDDGVVVMRDRGSVAGALLDNVARATAACRVIGHVAVALEAFAHDAAVRVDVFGVDANVASAWVSGGNGQG